MAGRSSVFLHKAVNKVGPVTTISQHWQEARQDVLESLADASAAVQATNLELRQGLEFICNGLSRAAQAAQHTSSELRKLGREIGIDFVDHLDGAAEALRICEHSGGAVQNETLDRLHESMRRVNMTNSGLQQLLGLKVLGRMTAAADEMREISVEVHRALGLRADALHYEVERGWQAAIRRQRVSALRHARRMASRLTRCLSFVALQCAFATWRGLAEAARTARGQLGRAVASAATGNLHGPLRSVPCLREALVTNAESVVLLHQRCLQGDRCFGRSVTGRLSLLCFWAWRSYITPERKTLELQQRQLWQICQASDTVNDAALLKQHLLNMLRIWRAAVQLFKRWRGEMEERQSLWLTHRLSAACRLLDGAHDRAGLLALHRYLQSWKHYWQVECLSQELRQTPMRIFQMRLNVSSDVLQPQMCFRSWQHWCCSRRRCLQQVNAALTLNTRLHLATLDIALLKWRSAVILERSDLSQSKVNTMQPQAERSREPIENCKAATDKVKRSFRQHVVEHLQEAAQLLARLVFIVWKLSSDEKTFTTRKLSSGPNLKLDELGEEMLFSRSFSEASRVIESRMEEFEDLVAAGLTARMVQSWRGHSLLHNALAIWRREVLNNFRCAVECYCSHSRASATHVAQWMADSIDQLRKRYFLLLWRFPLIVQRSSALRTSTSETFVLYYERLYREISEHYYLTEWRLNVSLDRVQRLREQPAPRKEEARSANCEASFDRLCQHQQFQILKQCCFAEWHMCVVVEHNGQRDSKAEILKIEREAEIKRAEEQARQAKQDLEDSLAKQMEMVMQKQELQEALQAAAVDSAERKRLQKEQEKVKSELQKVDDEMRRRSVALHQEKMKVQVLQAQEETTMMRLEEQTRLANCEASYDLLCHTLQSQILKQFCWVEWHMYVLVTHTGHQVAKHGSGELTAANLDHRHRLTTEPELVVLQRRAAKVVAYNKEIIGLLFERLQNSLITQSCFSGWLLHVTLECAREVMDQLESQPVVLDESPRRSLRKKSVLLALGAPACDEEAGGTTTTALHGRDGYWPARDSSCLFEAQPPSRTSSRKSHSEASLFNILVGYLQLRILERCYFTEWRLSSILERKLPAQSQRGSGEPQRSGIEHRNELGRFAEAGKLEHRQQVARYSKDVVSVLCERMQGCLLKQVCFAEWRLLLTVECAQQLLSELSTEHGAVILDDDSPRPILTERGPGRVFQFGEEVTESCNLLDGPSSTTSVSLHGRTGYWPARDSTCLSGPGEIAATYDPVHPSGGSLHEQPGYWPARDSTCLSDLGDMAFTRDPTPPFSASLHGQNGYWPARDSTCLLDPGDMAGTADPAPPSSATLHGQNGYWPARDSTCLLDPGDKAGTADPTPPSSASLRGQNGYWPARDSTCSSIPEDMTATHGDAARDSVCLSTSEEVSITRDQRPRSAASLHGRASLAAHRASLFPAAHRASLFPALKIKSRASLSHESEGALLSLCKWLQSQILERHYFAEWSFHVSQERTLHVQTTSRFKSSKVSFLETNARTRDAGSEPQIIMNLGGISWAVKRAVKGKNVRLHQRPELLMGAKATTGAHSPLPPRPEDPHFKQRQELSVLDELRARSPQQLHSLHQENLELRRRLRTELAEDWCLGALRSACAAWVLEVTKVKDARLIEELSHELKQQQEESEYLRRQLTGESGLHEDFEHLPRPLIGHKQLDEELQQHEEVSTLAEAAGSPDQAAGETPDVVSGPRTTIAVVPQGGVGEIIEVPHPDDRRQSILVAVPAHALVGQTMLVPVPALTPTSTSSECDSQDELQSGLAHRDPHPYRLCRAVLKVKGLQERDELVLLCIRMWRMHTLVRIAEAEVKRQAEALRKVALSNDGGTSAILKDDATSASGAACHAGTPLTSAASSGAPGTGGLESDSVDPESEMAWMDAMQRLVDDLQRENASLHAAVLVHQRQTLSSPGFGSSFPRHSALL